MVLKTSWEIRTALILKIFDLDIRAHIARPVPKSLAGEVTDINQYSGFHELFHFELSCNAKWD